LIAQRRVIATKVSMPNYLAIWQVPWTQKGTPKVFEYSKVTFF